MSEKVHIDSEVLARYLCGESDADEQALVDKWAVGSPTNASELAAFRSTWDQASGISEPDVDIDAAWQKVSQRIDGGNGQATVVKINRPQNAMRWLAAAAVLAGLCFAGVRLFVSDPSVRLIATNDYRVSTLQDGSTVTLFPNSSSTISMGDERQVALTGEAFFDVARDEQHPFVVAAHEVKIVVLGTAFEVSAYDTSDVVTVRVKHGKVRVIAASDSLELGAGDQVRVSKLNNEIIRSSTRTIEKWGDRIIQFQAAPMSEVVDQLERMFEVDIRLANMLQGKCKLTATFENEPIHDILLVIAQTYGFDLTETTEGSYLLQGDGC